MNVEISLPFVIVMMVVCAFGAQYIMQPKGYGPVASRALGLFLGPLGIIIALLMPYKVESSTETDKAKALREYKALLDEGAISKSEFDAKKRELLG